MPPHFWAIIIQSQPGCNSLYKFENDQKNFGCVGSCGYAPASVKQKRPVSTFIEDTGKDYLGNILKALVSLTQGGILMFKKVKSQKICKSQGAFERNMCLLDED